MYGLLKGVTSLISETEKRIEMALGGDREALGTLLAEVHDLVFTLSLRMLGTIADAEDASQEIIIKIMTNLSSFRRESSFSTWVYRVAVNYLINCKKLMFSQRPLSFEIYGGDIGNGFIDELPDEAAQVDRNLLAEELKLSCTNVMLQCLDPESRCIYILGTMFRFDSRTAGDLLNLSAENYRQKLSRAKKSMADFLSSYCGLSGTGMCDCKKRIGYAVRQRRLNPGKLEYTRLDQLDGGLLLDIKNQMESLDDLSAVFSDLPKYKAPNTAQAFLKNLLKSPQMQKIQTASEEAL
jgi:RNA polymerase sigma factor (sigma-70 family)